MLRRLNFSSETISFHIHWTKHLLLNFSNWQWKFKFYRNWSTTTIGLWAWHRKPFDGMSQQLTCSLCCLWHTLVVLYWREGEIPSWSRDLDSGSWFVSPESDTSDRSINLILCIINLIGRCRMESPRPLWKAKTLGYLYIDGTTSAQVSFLEFRNGLLGKICKKCHLDTSIDRHIHRQLFSS